MQQSLSLSKNNQPFEELFYQNNQDQEEGTFIQLILQGFSQRTPLLQIRKAMFEEYPFISFIQIIDKTSLGCYFQSMTDLIEIDEGKTYGATKAYIKNHFSYINTKKQIISRKQSLTLSRIITEGQRQQTNLSEFKITQEDSIYKIDQQQSTMHLRSYLYIPSPNSLKEKPNILQDTFNSPKLERLTSLEDQLKEIQKLHNHFDIFKSAQQIDAEKIFNLEQRKNNRKFSQNSTQQNSKINLNDYKQEDTETWDEITEKQQKKQNDIIKPFMEGVLFTTFIWGGIKLAKFIFKSS